MVAHAVGECAGKLPVGLLLVGDGPKRHRLEILAERYPTVAVLPRVDDRNELARLLASGDALVHGCEAETFCLVAAEARASGIPLIVPDRGAALDQLVAGAGSVYHAGRERSLEEAIATFIERGPELQRAAAARARHIRTMQDHFTELFARYEQLVHVPAPEPATENAEKMEGAVPLPEFAIARSAVRLR
jgi:alpha-1,6-mannosyltransferase